MSSSVLESTGSVVALTRNAATECAEPRRGERTKKKRVFFGEEAKESEEEEQDEEDEEVASASPRRARSMTLFGFPRRVRASGNCGKALPRRRARTTTRRRQVHPPDTCLR